MIDLYTDPAIVGIISMQSVLPSRLEPVARTLASPCSQAAPMDDLNVAELPASGISPVLDLQRRLGEAALRGFYTVEPVRQGIQRKNYALAGAVAVLAWGMVFGVGMTLIG